MIKLTKASERRYQRHPEREAWRSFSGEDRTDPFEPCFGALKTFQEGRLAPRAGTRAPRQDAELITYVREGTLIYEDSTGHCGLLRSGDFQRTTVGRGIRYSEANASPTDWAHVFQVWLRPSEADLEPGRQQKRFSVAERRGVLCTVASPDARNGSLRVHQDAFVYSSVLVRGQHVIHEIAKGRGVWLHVVDGNATIGAVNMGRGDGVAISDERAVSLTATADAELLLLDLGHVKPHGDLRQPSSLSWARQPPDPRQRGSAPTMVPLAAWGRLSFPLRTANWPK